MDSSATIYQKQVIPKHKELFGVANVMDVPRITKVVLNARVKRGGNVSDEKVLDTLTKITGQKAVPTRARKSISNFKIREGMVLGARVTLRGQRAFSFVDKLVHVALPRARDFSGIATTSFDGNGNLTIGLREHAIFPEVASDDISQLHGLQITVSTTARTDKDAQILLAALGFPFKRAAGASR